MLERKKRSKDKSRIERRITVAIIWIRYSVLFRILVPNLEMCYYAKKF